MKIDWHISSPKWLIIIFLLKGLLFSYFAFELHQLEGDKLVGGFFRVYDDTRSYYDPIENLIDGRGYSRLGFPEYGEAEYVLFAGRMPGLLPIYGPLYAMLGKEYAKVAMVFLQFLMGCLGVWLLGQIAWRLLASQKLAFAAMGAYLIYYPLHIYEHAGASESLSIVFSLLAFYFLLIYQEKEERKWIWLAGLFIAWAICLRPIFGTFLLGFLVLFYRGMKGESLGLSFSTRWLVFLRGYVIPLIFPLVLVLSLWTIRNVISLNRVVVLEDVWHLSYPHEPEYGSGGMAIRKLIRAWGGDMLYWTDGSMGNVLMNASTRLDIKTDLPQRIYTPDYQADSLILLSKLYHKGNQQKSAEMATRYLHSFQKYKPLEAYFFSRIRLTYKFFFRLIRHDLPFPSRDNLKTHQFLIKGFYIGYYYLWAVLGIMGALFVLFKNKNKLKSCLLFPLSMALTLGMYLGMIEERYLLPLFPFMLIYGLYLMQTLPFMRKITPFNAKS